MFHAGYATGFKSGGTNTDRIHPTFSQLFDAETSETFEVGVKADFPDQNLRANPAPSGDGPQTILTTRQPRQGRIFRYSLPMNQVENMIRCIQVSSSR